MAKPTKQAKGMICCHHSPDYGRNFSIIVLSIATKTANNVIDQLTNKACFSHTKSNVGKEKICT